MAVSLLLARQTKAAPIFAHASLWIATVIGPLALWLLARRVPAVRVHAAEAFNFQVTWAAVLVGGSLVAKFVPVLGSVVGLALFAVAVMGPVLSVSGIISAASGAYYHYPLRLRLLPDGAPRRRKGAVRYFDADGRPLSGDDLQM